MKCAFVLFCIVALAYALPPKPSEILKKIQNKIEKLDKSCTPIFPMKGLNMTWMKSVEKWYIAGVDRPLWDFSLGSMTSPETVREMNDRQKLQACMHSPSFNEPEKFYYKIERAEPQFNKPIFNPIRIGEIDWTINVNGTEEYLCAVTIVDSDNESYFIAYEYWPNNGIRGIWISSVEKTVPQEVHDLTMEKMELLLGFTDPKEHYLKLDNSKCP